MKCTVLQCTQFDVFFEMRANITQSTFYLSTYTEHKILSFMFMGTNEYGILTYKFHNYGHELIWDLSFMCMGYKFHVHGSE